MSSPSPLERELDALAAQLKKVETEYTMYFSGRSPRPPHESRTRLDRAFRQLERTRLEPPILRFKFSTLQARYSSFVDLWDRGVRAREEGRAGPFARPARDAAPPTSTKEELLHAASFGDPARIGDGARELYAVLMEARQQEGREPVPFEKFETLVREQVRTLQEKHPGAPVWFRVSRREGKVTLAARVGMRPEDEGER